MRNAITPATGFPCGSAVYWTDWRTITLAVACCRAVERLIGRGPGSTMEFRGEVLAQLRTRQFRSNLPSNAISLSECILTTLYNPSKGFSRVVAILSLTDFSRIGIFTTTQVAPTALLARVSRNSTNATHEFI